MKKTYKPTALRIIFMGLLALVMISAMFGCNKTNGAADDETEDKSTPVAFADKDFASAMSSIFAKSAAELTREELSSVRYIYFSNYDGVCNISVGFDDYMNETDFDARRELLKRTAVKQISSFEDMKYLTGVRDFATFDVYTFDSFDDLRYCKELESVSIHTDGKNTALKKLDGAEKLGNLKRLEVSGAIIEDVSILGNGGLENLESLSLGADYRFYDDGDKCFEDISSFANLKKLESLSINFSGITDISCLRELPLKYLSLYRCGLSDVSVLADIKTLEDVSLMYNAIEDVSPFAELPNLRVLYLDYNYIKDVSPLAKLSSDKIEYISLDMNAVEDWTSVRALYEEDKLNPGFELYFPDEE